MKYLKKRLATLVLLLFTTSYTDGMQDKNIWQDPCNTCWNTSYYNPEKNEASNGNTENNEASNGNPEKNKDGNKTIENFNNLKNWCDDGIFSEREYLQRLMKVLFPLPDTANDQYPIHNFSSNLNNHTKKI